MKAEASRSRIVEIATRSMYGESIDAADVKEALRALNSTVPQERYAASVILLQSKPPEFSILSARDTIERDCRNSPAEADSSWLTWAISYLPDEELAARESIRLFIYRSSFSDQVACRANTMTILARLATRGDSIALALLRICVLSTELKVRTNARSSLRMVQSELDSATEDD